jgi:sensor histidine kinase regulating citrate/malate metabolism
MSVGVSVLCAQAAATTSSSSTFTWGDAITIFVLVIVALLVLFAFVGRRSKRLTYRPRPKETEHIAEFREAAEEDIEAIEDEDGGPVRRDVPGSREDDL